MKTLKYIGGLESGTVVHPRTRQEFPFTRGGTISIPDETATDLLTNNPSEWEAQTDNSND